MASINLLGPKEILGKAGSVAEVNAVLCVVLGEMNQCL